jgi:hypothetical protein
MPFVDVSSLRLVERLPGLQGRNFHSPSLTFAHYDFVRGASVHEHFHPQEEEQTNAATRLRTPARAHQMAPRF